MPAQNRPPLDQFHDLVIVGERSPQKVAQKRQRHIPIDEIAKREFTNDESVGQNLRVFRLRRLTPIGVET
jgi:hypothetical protein